MTEKVNTRLTVWRWPLAGLRLLERVKRSEIQCIANHTSFKRIFHDT
jgi:hypothetical protein